MILPLQAKISICAASIFGAAWGGWWLRDLQSEAEDGARATAEAAADRRMNTLADRVANRTENAVAGIRIENRTIFNETQREIKTNTVYSDCVLTPGGLLNANKARSGSAGQLGAAVPSAAAAASEIDHGRSAVR